MVVTRLVDALNVYPFTVVCGVGPAAGGGAEGGEKLGHDCGVIGGRERRKSQEGENESGETK